MSHERAQQFMREVEAALSGCIVALELGETVDRDFALQYARQVYARVKVLLDGPGAPFIAFSSEGLAKLPEVTIGQVFGDCPHCGNDHVLVGQEGASVLFYICKGRSHIGAIDGRLVAFEKPDMGGEL
jgi:hypothetical protein